MSSDYPCPCCGHRVFDEAPGSYEICPICFWEDDLIQLRWPTFAGGANSVSLVDAQRNYEDIGACEERLRSFIRLPATDEPLDDAWRRIDLTRDNFENWDNKRRAPWPADPTVLYWWLPTFWRHSDRAE
ncbi:CPCC family cysteine-rich protein [Nocardia sp. NPDC004568]|uniref:CPCC family cysteine-rich protein n=1 Tax=Nocardia sp. NPDC004568 TaxID=3154551 RepID=UPI0033B5F14F